MTEPTTRTSTTTANPVVSSSSSTAPILLTSPNIPSPYCPPARRVTADNWTTSDQLERCPGYLADPLETTIVVCTRTGCRKYFQNIERFAHHRKTDHGTTNIATDMWVFGDPAGPPRGRQ